MTLDVVELIALAHLMAPMLALADTIDCPDKCARTSCSLCFIIFGITMYNTTSLRRIVGRR